MLITMLENVRPEEYGYTGQAGWGDSHQWLKGVQYDLDQEIACNLMNNGDAYNSETEEEGFDDWFKTISDALTPPSKETMEKIMRKP